jgi:uncharacterized NAD-dependent epimerase/dehydratase family protein
VRVDFAAGAVEQVVMRFGNNFDILQIEGQGSRCTSLNRKLCRYCVHPANPARTSTPADKLISAIILM